MRYVRLVLLMGFVTLAALLVGTPGGRADEPEPDMSGEEAPVPPPEPPGEPGVGEAPSTTQTSEFMAGRIVYSVVFVESSGGTGNCSPADPQSENWSSARRAEVMSEIQAGLAFWNPFVLDRPDMSFIQDNWGARPTSCEPITHPGLAASSGGYENYWIADVLTAMGYPTDPAHYFSAARSFAASRRNALGADWGFIIFVVDSANDTDGRFAANPDTVRRFAYTYLNGPFTVMNYKNDGWGIGQMNLVTAHETGHIFGALDEYASSNCSTADTWGYLNAANTSCNNGGVTSDASIMGEAAEQTNPNVGVSTSARQAIGWRNPAVGDGNRVVVDVVRTAAASLTPHTPDPTTDATPTYSALAFNNAYPPGGCNNRVSVPGDCERQPMWANISKVLRAQWNVDGGPFTSAGVVAVDGVFDEESEPYTFTPASPQAPGTHTFGTRSINSFGHISTTATDTLTILLDTDGDGIADVSDNDDDGDGYWDYDETNKGSNPLAAGSTPEHCEGVDNDGDTAVDVAPAGGNWDTDGDTVKDCLDASVDTDGDTIVNTTDDNDDNDGSTDARERYMSTDELGYCPTSSSHDAWPYDTNRDRTVDSNDLLGSPSSLKNSLGSSVGQPKYNRRFDFNADGTIDTDDLLGAPPLVPKSFKNSFGSSCVP